jgi:hypothetical protein
MTHTLTIRRSTRTQLGAIGAVVELPADQAQRVEFISNYWQLLWRASLVSGLTSKDPVIQKLDATMGQWWIWRTQYHDAWMRQWIPLTRSWSTELDAWATRVDNMQTELDTATHDAVSKRLAQQGLDRSMTAPDVSRDILQQALVRTRDLLKSSWFWPVVGTVGVLIAIGTALKLYKGVKSELA